MMMVQCMKGVSSKDLQNVNRQFIFIKVEHFIEVKSSQIKPMDKENYQHISFTIKENGLMTYPMEKEGKFMGKIHILMVTLFKVGNKVGDCTTGMLNNVILDSS